MNKNNHHKNTYFYPQTNDFYEFSSKMMNFDVKLSD